MRVVGGAWRGRRLVTPAGRATRPTADKVREAIFDVLAVLPEVCAAALTRWDAGQGRAVAMAPAGPLAGHLVLDLYAGSGALGIEALSRGAAWCTFVERERAALAALRRNLASVGVTIAGGRVPVPAPHSGAVNGAVADADGAPCAAPAPVARVVAAPVGRALQADARAGYVYTLVLADPPYARSADALGTLARLLGPVLAPQAVIVVETSVREDVQLPWRVVRVKVYGDTKVSVLSSG